MGIAENYINIKQQIVNAARQAGRNPEDITLLPVTKNRTAEDINTLLALGAVGVGENRAQEWVQKQPGIRQPCALHFIGQLQTNKVKYILKDAVLIHSVDRLSLAEEINRLAAQINKQQPVLVEINSAFEEQRGGIPPLKQALAPLLGQLARLPCLQVKGLMTVAPLKGEPRACFATLRELGELFTGEIGEKPVLSMGMTDDFPAAIAEGSTLVRIGRALFV